MAAHAEAQEKIGKIQGIEETTLSLQERMLVVAEHPTPTHPANKAYFDSLMNQESQPVAHTEQRDGTLRPYQTEEVAKVPQVRGDDLTANGVEPGDRLASPMEEAAKLQSGASPYVQVTSAELIAQNQQAVSKIQALREDLNRPGLEIQTGTSHLMRRHLENVDGSLKVASNKLGMDESAPLDAAAHTSTNPVEKFLGMLTHSQDQMQKMDEYIAYLDSHPDRMNPAAALSVQIKMHHIVTELEFFTSLLNKSLEGTKTIMQVQV